jgi:hypothetical protein
MTFIAVRSDNHFLKFCRGKQQHATSAVVKSQHACFTSCHQNHSGYDKRGSAEFVRMCDKTVANAS